jgi:outer membrane protein OmpU
VRAIGAELESSIFATTALIATAGIASADITLTGGAIAGFKSSGAANTDTILHTELDFNIVASGESDNGVSFGASLDIDTDTAAAGQTGSVSDGEVFITSAFGTLSFGAMSAAIDGIGVATVGFDGIGVDSAVEGLRVATGADLTYSYSIDGLTLTLSTVVGSSTAKNAGNEGDFGMLVGYKMGDLGIKVGYSDDHSTGDTSTGIELAYKVGAVSLAATYVQLDYKAAATRDLSGYGVSVGYAVNDALGLTAVYASAEQGAAGTADRDDFGVGFNYKLGGGLAVVGGVGEVNKLDVWDLGLTMSF